MIEVYVYFISIFLVILEFLSLHELCKHSMSKCKSFHLFIILGCGIFILRSFIPLESFVILNAFTLILNFILIHLFFNGSFIRKAAITITFQVLLYSIDFIVTQLSVLITQLSINQLVDMPFTFISNALFSKFFLFIVCYALSRRVIPHEKSSPLNLLQLLQLGLYLFLTISSLYIVNDILFTYENNLVLLTFILIMILSALGHFYTIDKLIEYNKTITDTKLLDQKLQLNNEKFVTLSNAYKQQRKQTHEFNNHLTALKALLTHKQYEKTITYINNVSQQNAEIIINTNNILIDVLLSEKYHFAKSNSIILEYLIDDLSYMPIPDDELVVIFSNILNNALEATLQVSSNRRIKLKVQSINNGYMINIQNCYTISDTSHIKASSSETPHHGYGLANIREILDKYGFEHSILLTDNIFSLTILLYR